MASFASKTRVITACALLLASGAGARPPLTIVTPSLRPDPNGYLECIVVASGHRPIEMVTTVVTIDGENVTAFSSSFRSGPSATADRRYAAEDRAGTFDDRESYCEVVTWNVNDRDVSVLLTSHGQDGVMLDSVSR